MNYTSFVLRKIRRTLHSVFACDFDSRFSIMSPSFEPYEARPTRTRVLRVYAFFVCVNNLKFSIPQKVFHVSLANFYKLP